MATKAVFWDRDGVLNQVLDEREDGLKNVGPQKFKDFKVMPGAEETLKNAKLKGYLNIIVTNQPDIARNRISWEELNQMHDFLKQHVPTIDAIYVCPHDMEGDCNCRKPKPGMLLDAAKDYHIELSSSFMVGDTQKDIDAGKAAGVKTVLFSTKYNHDVTGQDLSVKNLQEIINLLK